MHQCPLFAVMGLHSYQLGPESGLGENTVSGGGGLSEMTSQRREGGDAACHPHKEDHVTPSTADPDHTFQLFALWITHRRDFWSFVCSVRHAANFAAFSSIALLAGCWLHHIPTNHAHHPCHQFSVVLSYSSRRRRAATKNHVHTFRSREKPSRGIGGECRVVNWKLNSTRCMYDPHRYCIKCKRRRRMWSR